MVSIFSVLAFELWLFILSDFEPVDASFQSFSSYLLLWSGTVCCTVVAQYSIVYNSAFASGLEEQRMWCVFHAHTVKGTVGLLKCNRNFFDNLSQTSYSNLSPTSSILIVSFWYILYFSLCCCNLVCACFH